MQNIENRSICLTLIWEDGFLSASLTDFRALGKFGRIEVPASLLNSLVSEAAQLKQQTAPLILAPLKKNYSEIDPIASLGSRIYSQLLPENIRLFLADGPARPLFLQINEALLPIPWEITFDGRYFLAKKFFVSRQILQNQAATSTKKTRFESDGLKVLFIHSNDELHLDYIYTEGLMQKLASVDGISVKRIAWGTVGHQQTLSLVGESDIIHCVGASFNMQRERRKGTNRVNEEWLNLPQIAALPLPPQLIVFERTNNLHPHLRAVDKQEVLATEVNRLNLSALFRNALLTGDDRPDFMAEFYLQLTRGHSIGEALREASSLPIYAIPMAGTCCLELGLYGDSTAVFAPQIQERPEDNNHRQITVLSYDLVESTKLLNTVGAEKYSDILDRFHHSCTDIINKWGGTPNDPNGNDGTMCYFGLPVAHEDSAIHAIHAAIEVIAAIGALHLQDRMQVPLGIRIGIVTGSVVVKAGLPVGPPIHYAARLQSIAEPGTAVVSKSTYQIAKDQFDFLILNHLPALKGIDSTVTAFRLSGVRQNGGEQLPSALRQTPFIGRESELSFLSQHWQSACIGAPRTVLLSGEAGIGKSRIVSKFRQTLALQQGSTLECSCTPDHKNSAFHPVIEMLLHYFNMNENDTSTDTLNKLYAGLAHLTNLETDLDNAVDLIASLLNLRHIHREHESQISSEKKRQSVMHVLIRWIKHQATNKPLCLIIEDVQWIDPSSHELLKHLVNENTDSQLLILLTQRNDARDKINFGFKTENIEINALPSEVAIAMIMDSCGELNLNPDALQILVKKADGVPLFIEESVRMLQEAIADKKNSSKDALAILKFGVPSTIQDLLMARLDHLAAAKQIAQLGATIGREFSLAIIEAVLTHESAPLRSDNLAFRLQSLVNSEILIEKGDGKDKRYFFRHGLIRDAAYQSLWERDRRKFHRSIALVMNGNFPTLAASQPEILAYHYSAAGLQSQALHYWENAARVAVSRSAHQEAISHVDQGLIVISALPNSLERDQTELRLQLILAAQLIATEGYGADRVGLIYQRSAALCEATGDQRALLKVQFGLEGYYFIRGDFSQAHSIAAGASDLAQKSTDPMSRVQAKWAVANILFHQGDLKLAVEQMDACIIDYKILKHRPNAVQDPGIMCLCYSALAQWELGYPQDALLRGQNAVALAEQLKHKFSLAEAYGLHAMLLLFLGDFQASLENSDRAINACEEGGFVVWLAHAKLIHGRCVAQLSDPTSGIKEMADGYAMWIATGATVTRAFYLTIQAEGLALANRPDEGLLMLQTAFDLVSRYGERYYEPEIRRLFGVLLLQSAMQHGEDREAEAERWFVSAITCASDSKMNALALRAANSLSDLWIKQGRLAEARETLELHCSQIHDARTTPDMARAYQLLASIKEMSASALPSPSKSANNTLIWEDSDG